MKTAIRLIAATLVVLSVATSAAAQGPAKRLIRVHTAGPADIGVDTTMLATRFMEQINANSSTLEVKVFPNSTLGQSREVIEAMRLGSGAAATTGGPGEYSSFVKRLGVLGLPFLWKSYDHANKVLDGPVGTELNADMEKAGFKILSWAVSWGYRNVVTAKKEITKAEDLKGLKIRTIPNKVFVAAVNTKFQDVMTELRRRKLGGRKFLREMPWYVIVGPPATGKRVRITYTIFPEQGDNPGKPGLIPHSLL